MLNTKDGINKGDMQASVAAYYGEECKKSRYCRLLFFAN